MPQSADPFVPEQGSSSDPVLRSSGANCRLANWGLMSGLLGVVPGCYGGVEEREPSGLGAILDVGTAKKRRQVLAW